MERHERYDPEDIEHLLSERSFDELLQEERAYVLRHLSGREEYETMRSLLQHMRREGAERMEIEPDEQVRGSVLAAFRAQQQPQWRIWLNSVAALFQVRENHGIWRPALAFGSLAILVGLGVWFATTMGPAGHEQVAEVKEVTTPIGTVPAAPVENKADEAAQEQGGTASSVSENEQVPAVAEVSEAVSGSLEDLDHAFAEETKFVQEEVASTEDEATDMQEKELAATQPAAAKQLEQDAVRTVGAEELTRNQSAVNISGAAETIAVAKRTRSSTLPTGSRTMDADPEVWALLATGW